MIEVVELTCMICEAEFMCDRMADFAICHKCGGRDTSKPIYVLTPSGGRPESLAMLSGYMAAQDYTGAFRWIVCDDCDPQSPVPDLAEVIRPSWRWSPGQNTQARSMSALLAMVPDGESVVVCEDDDYYAPDHLTTMAEALKTHEIVGQRVSYYANVKTGRTMIIPGTYHASLGATALRGAAIDLLRRICESQSDRLDVTLWRQFTGRKALLESRTAIGVKGLPGRGGIGIGHRDTFGQPDQGCAREWLGDRFSEYQRLVA